MLPLILGVGAVILGAGTAIKISDDANENTANELKMKEIALKEMQTIGTSEQIAVQRAISQKYIIPSIALAAIVLLYTQRDLIARIAK